MKKLNEKKYKSYINFSYAEVSRPNQTFWEQINSVNKIYFNNMFRTQYFKDLKSLTIQNDLEEKDKQTLKIFYKVFKISDIIIFLYIPYSFVWHYNKKYFHKGSKFLEFYIVAKIFFNVFLLNYSCFVINKLYTDPISYKHFSKLEELLERKKEEKKLEYQEVSSKNLF